MRKQRTAREIAERLGVHPRTVQRYISRPRAEWLEQNSIERVKPWEMLGISRATWYRRGKPQFWERYTRTQSGAGFEVSEA